MAAEIDHDPGDIAEEGDGDGGTDEREQGLHHTQADHIVSALRAITWRGHTHARAHTHTQTNTQKQHVSFWD